ENCVKWFRHLELVPDAGCLLDFSVIDKVFQTWRSDGPHEERGFSLDTLEGEDDFKRAIVSGWPADGPLQTWGMGNELTDADVSRIHTIPGVYPWEHGVRARLRDRLGVEAFNPEEEHSEKVAYLVDSILPLFGVHMFVAKPETLKSFTALKIAI